MSTTTKGLKVFIVQIESLFFSTSPSLEVEETGNPRCAHEAKRQHDGSESVCVPHAPNGEERDPNWYRTARKPHPSSAKSAPHFSHLSSPAFLIFFATSFHTDAML